jgi:hypothetical protein
MQYVFATEEGFTHSRIVLVATRNLIISLYVETWMQASPTHNRKNNGCQKWLDRRKGVGGCLKREKGRSESGSRLVTALNAVSHSFSLHCNFSVHEGFASKLITCGWSSLRSFCTAILAFTKASHPKLGASLELPIKYNALPCATLSETT